MLRAELVITTGGLGPTSDDITKKAICKYFKRPLVFHENILATIESRFKKRGITMPAINQNQALLPQGAEFIENERGSAVGIVFEENGHIFISLPGVPDEMMAMVSGWVANMIKIRSGGLATIHRKLHTVGIFESAIFEKIADLPETKNPSGIEERLSIAFLPSWRGVDIRLTIVTRNAKEGKRQVDGLESKITERVGKYIYGYDNDTLPEVVGKLLRERKMTLAVAESCTGGLLGKIITDISGSSDYFLGGFITYSNELKKKYLSVSDDILNKYGAVSAECAIAMAEGARNSTGSSIAVSITGIAGPLGGTPEKPVGLVYIGLAADGKAAVEEHNIGNIRERNRERSATFALNMVRKYLLGEL
jgi:nicotinamide-nucleotide amidase